MYSHRVYTVCDAIAHVHLFAEHRSVIAVLLLVV
jgi:hypothetical protein